MEMSNENIASDRSQDRREQRNSSGNGSVQPHSEGHYPTTTRFSVCLRQRDIIVFQKIKEPKKVNADTLYSAPAQVLYIMDAGIDVEHGVLCQSLWMTSARRPETAASNTEQFKNSQNCVGQFFNSLCHHYRMGEVKYCLALWVSCCVPDYCIGCWVKGFKGMVV